MTFPGVTGRGLNGVVPNPEAVAAALVDAHAGPVDGLPDGHRLVDYAESGRSGDWTLRSALVRFAQPEPTRAGSVLELIRRTDGALKPHRRRLESVSAPSHPDLGEDLVIAADGVPSIRSDARRVLDAPVADLARAAHRLDDGDAIVAAYVAVAGDHPSFEAIPLLAVALELDAIAEALVPWARTHEGPPPVEAVDERTAVAFERLGVLGVPRETGGRPPASTRG